MTYYSTLTWWDSNFKIRRPITITPAIFLPGREKLYAVKITKDSIAGKIKNDYSDLRVIYQIEGETPVLVPYSVIDEIGYLSIVFPPVESLVLFEPATPAGVQYADNTSGETNYLETWTTDSSSTEEYFLYYSAKNKTKNIEEGAETLFPYSPRLSIDLGQKEDQTRFTFTKPTVDWISNSSNKPNAAAYFNYIGHNINMVFQAGPEYGKLKYRLDNGDFSELDCYSSTDLEVAVLAGMDDGYVGSHGFEIIVLGDKNPASSSNKVKLLRAEFSETLIGIAESEEYLSDNGKTLLIGS